MSEQLKWSRRARGLASVTVLVLLFALLPSVTGVQVVAAPRAQVETVEGFPTAQDASQRGVRRSQIVRAPIAFSMMGFRLPEGVDHLRVRTSRDGEEWTAWSRVDRRPPEEGPDPGTAEARSGSERVTEPVWVDSARYLQISLPAGGEPQDVQATVIDSSGLNGGAERVRVVRDSGPEAAARPDIVTRSEWGAAPYDGSPYYADGVHMFVVHHTVTGNDYSESEADDIVRAIQAYHQDTNGWDDIGYNMLVDRFGNVYEGRAGGLRRAVVGAHAAGWNTGSSGIAMLGTHTTANPTSAALSGLLDALAWKADIHGVDPEGYTTRVGDGSRKRTISGHRDVGSTECPGDDMYDELGWMRSAVADQLITPVQDGLASFPAQVSWGPGSADFLARGVGEVDAVWRGGDSALKHRVHRDESWSPSIHDLGGILTGAPSVTSWAPGRVDVVVTGTNRRLFHKWYDDGSWHGFTRVPGRTASSPAVVSWGTGRLDVVFRGVDDQLRHSWYVNGAWRGPESLGGRVAGAPTVVSWEAGRLNVVVRGTNGHLYERRWANGSWHGFRRIPGRVGSSPDAISWGPGRIDVFARGVSDQLTHSWYRDGAWRGPEGLGGVLAGPPKGFSWESGRLDVLVSGTDGRMHHKWFLDGWHGFAAFEP